MEKDQAQTDDIADYHGSVKGVKQMADVYEVVEDLIEAIRENPVYQDFIREKERVKKHPQLKKQIDEYRQRNFELQSLTQNDELFDKIEQFQKEYEEFLENPLVMDFLEAEVAFCRLIQDITGRMVQAIDFD